LGKVDLSREGEPPLHEDIRARRAAPPNRGGAGGLPPRIPGAVPYPQVPSLKSPPPNPPFEKGGEGDFRFLLL